MSSVCVIPAKGSSRRIPGKNIRDFCGKPIIAYSISAAKESELFERVIVSTDSEAVAEVAQKYGADILMRPGYLAEHEGIADCGTQEVTRHALQAIEWKGEYACCIYPCAPLMIVDDIKLGFEKIQTPGVHYVYGYGVSEYRDRILDSGTFYWYTDSIMSGREYPITDVVHIPQNRFCDINTEDDWQKAEKMYKDLHGLNPGL